MFKTTIAVGDSIKWTIENLLNRILASKCRYVHDKMSYLLEIELLFPHFVCFSSHPKESLT